MTALPPDLQKLADDLDANERDARAVVDGLTEGEGTWRANPGSWSIAECLDHLGAGNHVYVAAMEPSAARALGAGRMRRRPAKPGLIGGWFANYLEPPAHPIFKSKAPKKIRPRPSPPLTDAVASFLSSQEEIRAFLRKYAAIDLASVRFPNPFIRGVRFSLATGLHVLTAHERRHLWQAWNVRRAIPTGAPSTD